LTCGKPIPAKRIGATGPQSKYCSAHCRDLHANIGRRRYTYKCLQCGREFATVSRTATYCSVRCRALSRTLSPKVCVVCGMSFQPDVRDQLCCGPVCAMVRRAATKRSIRTERQCQQCGAMFSTGASHPHRKFCSIRCARAASCHRRQARQRAGSADVFDAIEIFERDGWRCAICGKPVRCGVNGKHPLQPSLDHILPLSEGGSHTRGNVRCTHLKCNLERGNRGAAQLRLETPIAL